MGALARIKLTVTDATNDMLRVNARFRYISSNLYAMCVRQHLHEVSHNRNNTKKIEQVSLAYVRIVIDPFR